MTSPDSLPAQTAGARGGKDKRVGDILLDSGLVTEQDIQLALASQKEQGGTIGRQLILQGAVTRLSMYRALAAQWETPLIDLTAQTVDEQLLVHQRADQWIRGGWMPYSLSDDGVISVASTIRLDTTAQNQIKDIYHASGIHVSTTTDWDLTRMVQLACRNELVFGASEALATDNDDASAKRGLLRWQKIVPVAIVAVSIVGLVLWPNTTIVTLLAFANFVFVLNVGFKVVSGIRGLYVRRQQRLFASDLQEARVSRGLPSTPPRIADVDLPIYTILVPAYKEANIIEKLVTNLGRLDYPKSKLEVLLLLEEDDAETIERVKQMNPPEYLRMLIVPPGGPQTKPRACNYGLSFAHGEFVVIYDAEDQPQPQQLRDVVAKFRYEQAHAESVTGETKPLVCVQAALNYFNADYNVLTRMFAIEYAHWFDSMLPGMDGTKIPIPLGGTSNHFLTSKLIEVGAWDPYNVTEDADLGMRIAVMGGRVGVINSTTWEEACAEVGAWIKQRTRWIKGYMMTAAVNLRHPVRWSRQNGIAGLTSLLALILGTPLAFMFYPIVFGFTIITYLGVTFSDLQIPSWLLVTGTANMLLSNLLMILFSGYAAFRRYNWRVAMFAMLNPLYWLLHSVAAWRAAYQMYFQPHKWEKTPHGLTEDYDDSSIVVN